MSGYIGHFYMIDDRVGQNTTWGVTDINRIGGAINYLQQEGGKYGLSFTGPAKDDYALNDFPTLQQWRQLTWEPLNYTCWIIGFGNVSELGEWTSYRGLDVGTANYMETSLLRAWDLLQDYAPLYTNAAYTGNYIFG